MVLLSLLPSYLPLSLFSMFPSSYLIHYYTLSCVLPFSLYPFFPVASYFSPSLPNSLPFCLHPPPHKSIIHFFPSSFVSSHSPPCYLPFSLPQSLRSAFQSLARSYIMSNSTITFIPSLYLSPSLPRYLVPASLPTLSLPLSLTPTQPNSPLHHINLTH